MAEQLLIPWYSSSKFPWLFMVLCVSSKVSFSCHIPVLSVSHFLSLLVTHTPINTHITGIFIIIALSP